MSGYIGNIPVPQATQTRDNFTATSGQTTFSTSGYTPNYLDVYLNGVHLDPSDYTATNGTDVVLGTGATAGDIVSVVAFSTFEAVDQDFSGDFSVDGSTFVVDSTNNNVGIGESSPAETLHVADNIRLGNTAPAELYTNSSELRLGVDRNNDNSTSNMTFYVDNDEKMRIDSSGNVGIGTSSPSTNLHITDANPQIRLQSTDTSGTARLDFKLAQNPSVDWGYVLANDSDNSFQIGGVNGIRFNSISGGTSTERMRIDSSGNLLVGTTTQVSNEKLSVYNAGGDTVVSKRGNNGVHFRFYTPSGNAGYIDCNNTSTNYATSSDYRLKTDVQPMTGATARLKALKPVNFEWISSGERVDGFIAHEAQEVVPEAVTGTKDAVQVWAEGEELPEGVAVGDNKLDEDGNTIPDYQGIDQSKLVPLLVAAMQEQQTVIEDLKARIEALEGASA